MQRLILGTGVRKKRRGKAVRPGFARAAGEESLSAGASERAAIVESNRKPQQPTLAQKKIPVATSSSGRKQQGHPVPAAVPAAASPVKGSGNAKAEEAKAQPTSIRKKFTSWLSGGNKESAPPKTASPKAARAAPASTGPPGRTGPGSSTMTPEERSAWRPKPTTVVPPKKKTAEPVKEEAPQQPVPAASGEKEDTKAVTGGNEEAERSPALGKKRSSAARKPKAAAETEASQSTEEEVTSSVTADKGLGALQVGVVSCSLA